VDRKILAVVVVVCSAAPPKAPRKRSLKKEKAKSNAGTPLLPPFALERLNLWNPTKGKGRLSKMFPTLRFKRPLALSS
jgi:hypothetical protein